MYPEEIVAPMRQEVVQLGVRELKTGAEVDKALTATPGTALVFVNSVCGCAAGMARPGLALALKEATSRPTHVYTVFAGNDAEATQCARKYFAGYPPSSPAFGLLRDGKVVTFVQRQDIEGHTAREVADKLLDSFATHCA